MIRHLSTAVSLALLSSASLAVPAHAQVYFSSYGPGDSYAPGGPSTTFAGYGRNAARFVPTISGEFDRVETSVFRTGPSSIPASVTIAPEITLAGTSSPGPQPGVVALWTATAAPLVGNTASIVTFTGPRATLTAGQPYWLILDAADTTIWCVSQPPVLGQTMQKTGSPWFSSSSQLPAFRVSLSGAAPATGACCNPATAGCTLLTQSACSTLGLSFGGPSTTCTPTLTCTACAADFNHSGGLSVDDIFAFLSSWFAGCP